MGRSDRRKRPMGRACRAVGAGIGNPCSQARVVICLAYSYSHLVSNLKWSTITQNGLMRIRVPCPDFGHSFKAKKTLRSNGAMALQIALFGLRGHPTPERTPEPESNGLARGFRTPRGSREVNLFQPTTLRARSRAVPPMIYSSGRWWLTQRAISRKALWIARAIVICWMRNFDVGRFLFYVLTEQREVWSAIVLAPRCSSRAG